MSADPGLQPERTALAWGRTAVAMLVNGTLLLRTAAEMRSGAFMGVAILLLLAALVLFGAGWHRQRALEREVAPRSPHAGIPLLVLWAVWWGAGAALLAMVR